MAQAIAYKNLGVAVESSYGASIALATYLPVKSFSMSLDPNFTLKEDTTASALGYDRSAYLRNVYDGSVDFNVDPISVKYWLKLGFGIPGTGVTVGTGFIPGGGATAIGFLPQNTGVLPSYRLDKDENTAVAAFLGIISKSMEIKSSGDFVEGSLTLSAKEQFTGTTLSPTGLTINPLAFAESKVYYGATITGCTTAVDVEDWSFTYDTQAEVSYLSGNRNANRVDAKIPKLSGSWTRFYDDTNFDTFVTNQSNRAIRIEIVSAQAYSGTSAYRLNFYFPNVRISKSERPYEAGGFIKETVTFEGFYDSIVGYMARAVLHNGQSIGTGMGL
jgi:hypothetical protein